MESSHDRPTDIPAGDRRTEQATGAGEERSYSHDERLEERRGESQAGLVRKVAERQE